MPLFMTLKESLQEFRQTETIFAPTVKAVLQLWLEAADQLPCHLQHCHTVAATHLASVALQQGLWPMEWNEPRLATWLETHLPGISTAMQDSVNSQLGISTRRVSILQCLVAGRQQPSDRNSDRQLLQRIQAERDTYRQLGRLAFVFLLISPIATLCHKVAEFDKRNRDGTYKQHCTDQHHIGLRLTQHSYRLHQGYSLIEKVAESLGDQKGALHQLHKDMDDLSRSLSALSRPVSGNQAPGAELQVPAADIRRGEMQGLQAEANERVPGDISAYEHGEKEVRIVWVSYASSAWLSLLARLPLVSDCMVHFLHHIDWHLLRYGLVDRYCRADQQQRIGARTALCKVLARPELCSDLLTMLSPEGLREVLRDFEVKAHHLQNAGLPAAVAQQLLSVPEGTPLVVVPGVVDRFGIRFCRQIGPQFPRHVKSAQGSVQRGGDVSSREAAAGSRVEPGQEDVLQDVGDLEDMQALLRLMYGTSLYAAQVEMSKWVHTL